MSFSKWSFLMINVALVHPSLSPFSEVSFKAMVGPTVPCVTFVNNVNYSFHLQVVCHAEEILRGMYLLEFMNFFPKGDNGYSTFDWKSDKKRRSFDKVSTSFSQEDQFSISVEVELWEAQERGQRQTIIVLPGCM